MPLIRALWLHYPDDDAAITRGDEYLWGRDILVAPVVERGAKQRSLYLPAGDWYDYWTREKHAGARELVRDVDLSTLPLYVRAGAIIPHDPVRQYSGEPTDKPTIVQIYAGRDGSFRWYDDDGATLDYQRGRFDWTRLDWDDDNRRLTIKPDGGESGPSSRKLIVELIPGGQRKDVQYDGETTEVTF
jgi:alpha-glucosidase/alpha-D-xyloside xylohydrolase